MVCAHVRSIIPSLKLGDYLSVKAHKPFSISHMHKSFQKILPDKRRYSSSSFSCLIVCLE